ncbi:hypothetical protein GTH44_38455 [Bradyrhizobium japonicum]|nr:hypothetical protein [Bradyrhizobium japonicum]
MRSIEPGISSFRARSFGPPRNDGPQMGMTNPYISRPKPRLACLRSIR